VSWVAVCLLDRIGVGRGVAALIQGGAVAIFRVGDDGLYAIDHIDPFTRAPVLARGLVGDEGGRPFVTSPADQHRFDLLTGACLDDAGWSVHTWPVRLAARVVEVDPAGRSTAQAHTIPVPVPSVVPVRSMSTGW
jgi:nitrite reductase (NADH) small subunit